MSIELKPEEIRSLLKDQVTKLEQLLTGRGFSKSAFIGELERSVELIGQYPDVTEPSSTLRFE